MRVLALVLIAASGSFQVVDDSFSLDPGQVKPIRISLHQRPAVIDGSFEVLQGGNINVSVLGRAGGGGSVFLRQIADSKSGSFRQAARRPGDFEVVLDNRGNTEPTTVKLQVELRFDAMGLEEPATLTAARRAVVVGVSLLFLGVLAVWFASRLAPAIERRKRAAPLPPW